jgi:hypothetical protein
MPTPQQDALATGLAELRTQAAETVTFRGGSVSALINRLKQPNTIQSGIDFGTKEGSTIWLPAATSPAPAKGEVITDGNSEKHRIQVVTLIDHSYQCDCEAHR